MAWTEDRVEKLAKLWASGLSASQVAKELGGVTRNAVIGKVHRLGLSGRAKPSRPTKRATAKRAAAPRTRAVSAAPRAPKTPAAPPRPVPMEAKLMDDGAYATILTVTEDMCKWPLGDPSSADFRFCGRGADKGDPYCKAHAQLAYQPARRRGVAVTRTIGMKHRRALR